ncbi:MAG: DUF362 domain-containing protein [Lachnotalea sp.]
MAYAIGKECINCGTCRDECPGNAISLVNDKYEVNQAKCISCGSCAFSCPVGAPKKSK